MKERPILFSAPMVRALLDGSKTQTRRVVKGEFTHDPAGAQDAKWYFRGPKRACWDSYETLAELVAAHCPYGQPGDRLWVRETWALDDEDNALMYRADLGLGGDADDWERNRLDGAPRFRWKPSIHMPRTASRITLEITGVRVERLQKISRGDAMAEGIVMLGDDDGFGLPDGSHFHNTDPRISYWSLWEAINGAGSVETNPWVWVVEFKKVTP